MGTSQDKTVTIKKEATTTSKNRFIIVLKVRLRNCFAKAEVAEKLSSLFCPEKV